MKKVKILIPIIVVAIATLSFVSFNSNDAQTLNQESKNEIKALKGAEKSGFTESNQTSW
ncbi:MAG TPA: hypothetical protein PKN99_13725 [Cyclobacteriaceae bacterium]|nr:hypothetical protein [Cyclobacteriaceae bacterium]HNP08685.1 hypothetical protein [Cyclobacteriaceae bacterium]